jgi:predicted acyl esterase
VDLVLMDGADFRPDPPESFALASCIGASWVFGGHRGTLRALKGMAAPGGCLLVGEVFWQKGPDPEYLAFEGLPRDLCGSHLDNVRTGEEEGLVPLCAAASNGDDWDRYETLQWRAAAEWAVANPDDSDRVEVREKQARSREAYLRWGRDTLGWALYLFQKPGPRGGPAEGRTGLPRQLPRLPLCRNLAMATARGAGPRRAPRPGPLPPPSVLRSVPMNDAIRPTREFQPRFGPLPWAAFLAAALAPALAAAQETVRLPMRDGTELVTDVWKPDASGTPRATLLRRTPYGRAMDDGLRTAILLNGYNVVSQDVRGRGGSAGEYIPFRDDAHDGYDTIDWIADQPWSTGRVGTFSASAEGIVQLMAAGEGHPAHRCAHVGVATGDVYEGMNPGGTWRKELTSAWLEALGEPEALQYLREHEALDADWDPMRLDATERARVAIPILMYGGYYDIFNYSTVHTYRLLRDEAAVDARDDQFLVYGPWTHGGILDTRQGAYGFPADSAYESYNEDFLALFDWCLRDGPRPAWASVRYYVMRLADEELTATGEWRTADTWPPPSTAVTTYLHDDGSLSDAPPAADGAAAEIPVDPARPVPARGGGSFSATSMPGPWGTADIDERDDVLTVNTPLATEDVELIGNVTARIWAASATTDVDVIVRLNDVTPGDRSIVLTDGALRGRYVRGLDAIRPLEPGVPTQFDVTIGPLSMILPAGHALRVVVSGTANPRYEPNPNVAEPIAGDPTPVATTLTVYRDEAHPSSVTLPVARGTLPGTDADADGDGDADAGADGDADVGGDAGADADAADVLPDEFEVEGTDADAPEVVPDVVPPRDGADAADAGTGGGGGCGCRAAGGARGAGVLALLAAGVLAVVCRRGRPQRRSRPRDR